MKKALILLVLALTGIVALGATQIPRKPVAKKVPITTKSKKKVMREKREDLFESLEEKVFRAPNSKKGKLAATDAAFDTGKKRMYYLNREEADVRELEAELGLEEQEHNFLGDKYDAVMDEYKTTRSEVEALEQENKQLKGYLARLDNMEKRTKTAAKQK
jgi:DNA repair exonuclease SbcCD ATPase subunit